MWVNVSVVFFKKVNNRVIHQFTAVIIIAYFKINN